MTYAVKEIFYSLQGEGAQVGRPAVFCRFAGCNLWSGREEDRATAVCQYCDTDFADTEGQGGGTFESALDLARRIAAMWPTERSAASQRFVVCTGGEPLLQLGDGLVTALHEFGFEVAIETNGTRPAPKGLDWICVSPKAGTDLVLRSGNELKLVYPQAGAEPEQYEALDFQHFFLQPMDGPERDINTQRALRYCLENPKWRLSLQTQKYLGIR